MLCEMCGVREATFHYSEVVNGVKNEHHLCSECAANTDISYYTSMFDNDARLVKLLSGILGNHASLGEDSQMEPVKTIKCPNCNMTYGDFVSSSKFGCRECYNVFGPLIADSIKKLQGSDTHIGKKPMMYGKAVTEDLTIKKEDGSHDTSKEIDFLSKRLKEAVSVEDYEEAARLRDQIKLLKSKEDIND